MNLVFYSIIDYSEAASFTMSIFQIYDFKSHILVKSIFRKYTTLRFVSNKSFSGKTDNGDKPNRGNIYHFVRFHWCMIFHHCQHCHHNHNDSFVYTNGK